MTEDDLVVHALTWALSNAGPDAPRSSVSGWTPNDVIEWNKDRGAAIRILIRRLGGLLPAPGRPALALAEFLEEKEPPMCEICQQPGHVCPECPWSDAGNGEPILG